jgi:hypothetical protein
MLYHIIIIINYITRIIEIPIKIVLIPPSFIPVKAVMASKHRVIPGLTRHLLTYDVFDKFGEYADGAHVAGHCKHAIA